MALSYRLKTEYDDEGNLTSRKAYLVYTPTLSYVSVDAESGKVYTERNTWQEVPSKNMATGGVMTKGVEPGSPQLTEEELRAAIEEAHKVGAKTFTHAQGMTGIKNALRAGIDSIEHGFFMDDWCFDWMKEHNVFFVPTLAAPYWIKYYGTSAGIPDYMVRKVENTIEAHMDTFRRAH
ncbi:MAG: amidohydrolase family protein, partial [Clostridia bacterium]|nr:amidohydrolase family protein [Clostridia bacterium]